MRRPPIASALLLLLAACGDDGKSAPTGPPSAPPAAPPSGSAAPPPAPVPAPIPSTAPPPPPPPAGAGTLARSPWADTREGDWATWDLRVPTSDVVTKTTWRATKVDARGVRYTVASKTLGVDGSLLSSVDSEELRAPGDAPPSGVPEVVEVGRDRVDALRADRADASGPVTLWISDRVPFSGLVRFRGAAVEQVLVAFGRGR